MQTPDVLPPPNNLVATVGALIANSLSWMGTLFTWMSSNAHMLLSVLATAVSIMGSVYTFRVARATLSKIAIDRELADHRLCADCITGHPPLHCPFPEHHQPFACPQRQEREQHTLIV